MGNSQITIPNPNDTTQPLVAINLSSHQTIKLTSTNYLSWKLQFHTLLIGYNLQRYVDGTNSVPPPTVTTNTTTTPNAAYSTWVRQDQLIFSAIVGSLSPSLVPLLQKDTTSHEAWTIIANTYAHSSKGHIKQLKDQLRNYTKGSRTITEYMQFIKSRADELALLGKPLNPEDLIERIIDGLDDDYTSLIETINSRDMPISFEELHEKLINRELSLRRSRSSTNKSVPSTANTAMT